jgi:pimeloyl-[acyl-carrier protein] methyl ester esterase
MSLSIKKYGVGTPLVLFHGWGFDSSIWTPIIPILSQHFTLYCVDLPGFGQSSLMDWVEFKKDLLSQLPQTFAIAGWSLGGLFATRLTLEVPNRVHRLFNIASSPQFIVSHDWPGIELSVFKAFYNNLKSNPQKTRAQFIDLQLKGVEAERPAIPKLVEAKALERSLTILLDWTFLERLNELKQPVNYWFGRLDGIVPHKTQTALMNRYPHFNFVTFKQSAHIPFLSEPSAFISLLQETMQ